MLCKLGAVLVLVPLVSALQLNPISNAASGGTVNITWTTQSGDLPTFTLELHNPTLFHNDIAIANTVNASAGSITLALPSLTPSDGYTLEAVQDSNITNILATSGDFSVAAASSTTSSTASSLASTTSGTTATTTSGAGIGTTISSGFGVTNSNTAASSTATSPSSTSSTSSTSVPSPINAGNSVRFGLNFGALLAISLGLVGGVLVVL